MSVSQPTSIAQEPPNNWNTMQKKLCFVFSLTVICYLGESTPVNFGSLEYDNLDSDLSDLTYEVKEKDLEDFPKLFDDADGATKGSEKNKAKTNVKASGFKKKDATTKGIQGKLSLADLKKYFKSIGLHDKGSVDDAGVYALAESLAAGAVEVDANENRKYKKGTKTKGFHRIQHKDEYKKDKEFYEEDETDGAINKVGAKGIGFNLGTGIGFKKGHFHHDRQKGIIGKQGFADKGYFDKEFSGFADSQGFEGSFKNES